MLSAMRTPSERVMGDCATSGEAAVGPNISTWIAAFYTTNVQDADSDEVEEDLEPFPCPGGPRQLLLRSRSQGSFLFRHSRLFRREETGEVDLKPQDGRKQPLQRPLHKLYDVTRTRAFLQANMKPPASAASSTTASALHLPVAASEFREAEMQPTKPSAGSSERHASGDLQEHSLWAASGSDASSDAALARPGTPSMRTWGACGLGYEGDSSSDSIITIYSRRSSDVENDVTPSGNGSARPCKAPGGTIGYRRSAALAPGSVPQVVLGPCSGRRDAGNEMHCRLSATADARLLERRVTSDLLPRRHGKQGIYRHVRHQEERRRTGCWITGDQDNGLPSDNGKIEADGDSDSDIDPLIQTTATAAANSAGNSSRMLPTPALAGLLAADAPSRVYRQDTCTSANRPTVSMAVSSRSFELKRSSTMASAPFHTHDFLSCRFQDVPPPPSAQAANLCMRGDLPLGGGMPALRRAASQRCEVGADSDAGQREAAMDYHLLLPNWTDTLTQTSHCVTDWERCTNAQLPTRKCLLAGSRCDRGSGFGMANILAGEAAATGGHGALRGWSSSRNLATGGDGSRRSKMTCLSVNLATSPTGGALLPRPLQHQQLPKEQGHELRKLLRPSTPPPPSWYLNSQFALLDGRVAGSDAGFHTTGSSALGLESDNLTSCEDESVMSSSRSGDVTFGAFDRGSSCCGEVMNASGDGEGAQRPPPRQQQPHRSVAGIRLPRLLHAPFSGSQLDSNSTA